MYYAFIKDNKISHCGNFKEIAENVINVEISQEIFDEIEKYIWDGEKIILDPDYEQKQKEKEQQRINKLTMTALDFIGVLEGFGLDYATEIKPFLNDNPNFEKQLTHCQNVYCGVVKAQCPITVSGKTITAEMVEQAFKNKYGTDE